MKELKGVQEGDALVVFYSENSKSITLDILDRIVALKLKYSSFKVRVGTKNALDFQLVSYLGFLIGHGENTAKYHIVSEDKGFDAVADFWKKQGVSVDCISFREQAKTQKKTDADKEDNNKKQKKTAAETKPAKKTSKVKSSDKASIKEIKNILSDEDMPDEVLKIFNQYKTKVSINNGLVKKFKDSKKASDVYKKLKPLLKAKNKS